MYETKSGIKLAVPNGVLAALLATALLQILAIATACTTVGAMAVLLAGYESDWLKPVRDWAWLVTTLLSVAIILSYWIICFCSVSVVSLSNVSPAMLLRTLFRSRWVSATLVSCLSLLGLLTAVNKIHSSIWDGKLSIIAYAALLAMSAVGISVSARELIRVIRKSGGSPMITDGVDPNYSESKAFSVDSAWRASGSDWVAPKSIVDVDTAVAYALMARSRSVTLASVGKGLSWVFGFVALTALLWSFDQNLHPSTAALTVIPASLVFVGYNLDRRSAELKQLTGDYAEVARNLSSESDDRVPIPRQSGVQRLLQYLRIRTAST